MEYLKVKEACKRLRVHENTMLKWLNDGTIKGVRFGKLWRIPDTEIERIDGDKTTVTTKE